MKRLLSFLLIFVLMFSLAACGSQQETSTEETKEEAKAEETTEAPKYKIGVITGTVSQGEEEFRAGQKIKEMYGDMIVTQTYPDNFMKEQETTISNILGVASDPDVKAIVMVQAIPGTSAAIDQLREVRPDILFIAGVPGEDPDVIASKADVVFQADELGMGTAVIDQANKMGAKTFVHYSFPRHMSYALLAKRRDLFKVRCEELGIKFVDATAPDPTGDAGVPGAQQFILEDVPRKIEEFGKDTAFFSTNCSMQEPLIKASLQGGAILPQQCCPSPYHGYPGALGIEIPDDKKGDIEFAVEQIKGKVAEGNGTGRFSTWPVPVNMMFVEAGVEYAKAYIEGQTDGKADQAKVKELFEKYAGVEMELTTYENEETGKKHDNFFMVLSGYITF
ncbi:DUF3798 domain-containing protein [Anaeromicrobium sediminis]|nr:DUF3798 domain-containing protein [Anaeromicrobium sediminis]